MGGPMASILVINYFHHCNAVNEMARIDMEEDGTWHHLKLAMDEQGTNIGRNNTKLVNRYMKVDTYLFQCHSCFYRLKGTHSAWLYSNHCGTLPSTNLRL